jgi:high-affinity nickel permease
VSGLDDAIAGLGGGGVVIALVAAVLLGLRHATDPDHLTAVSTLELSEGEDRRARRAAILGLSWGAGHATMLIVLGLPLVLLSGELPSVVERGAEAAVGVVIVVLAVRLLVRWKRGYLHVHPHVHGAVRHAHPHVHEHALTAGHPHEQRHDHAHPETLGRSPLASYSIGLLHGIGGSAGVGILLVGSITGGAEAAAALLLFAVATAVSMAAVSAAFGYALALGPALRAFERLVPVLGAVSLLFGAWYLAAAI